MTLVMMTAMATAMCLVIALVGLGHSLVVDTVVTLLLGLSFGCQFSPMTVTIQNAVDPRDGGVAISCMTDHSVSQRSSKVFWIQ